MIKVSGLVRLRGNYEVILDMTEEQFDKLSKHEQNEEIENAIDWRNLTDSADIDDVDVDDVEEGEFDE